MLIWPCSPRNHDQLDKNHPASSKFMLTKSIFRKNETEMTLIHKIIEFSTSVISHFQKMVYFTRFRTYVLQNNFGDFFHCNLLQKYFYQPD